MPYCPKCDMEFIDGITVCSDCGGPLVESEEAAKAMKKQERKAARERERAMMEELMDASSGAETDPASTDNHSCRQKAPAFEPARVYVDKAQRYDDLKSSASAFLIIGGLLLAFSVLCWAGIIRLPMAGVSKLIFQGALTAMGLFSMGVFFSTSRSARQLAPEINEEKHQTEDLITWFLDTYTADSIDSRIPEREALSEEELSLKRFQLIQDDLITQKDLPDPSYVDALCEEIYTRLYEN